MRKYEISNSIFKIVIFCISSLFLSSCASLYYDGDDYRVIANKIENKNVGFAGYDLFFPENYKLLSDDLSDLDNKELKKLITRINSSYVSNEGLRFHYHKKFVFLNKSSIIYFLPIFIKQPFSLTNLRRTEKEVIITKLTRRGLHNNDSKKVFSPEFNYKIYSEDLHKTHSIIDNKQYTNLLSYREYIILGKLNDIYILLGVSKSEDRTQLHQDLGYMFQNFNVLSKKRKNI